jgi:hypothetical protein
MIGPLRTSLLFAFLAALTAAPALAGGGSIPLPTSDTPPPCTARQMERARDLVINGGHVAHRPAPDSCLTRVAQRRAINMLDGAAEPFWRTFNDDAFIGAESFDRECVAAVFWNHENQWLRKLKTYWVEGGRCPE